MSKLATIYARLLEFYARKSISKRNTKNFGYNPRILLTPTSVDEKDNSINVDLVVQTAIRFGITESDATVYAEQILKIVRDNWSKIAAGYGLTRRQVEEMRPAFSACYE